MRTAPKLSASTCLLSLGTVFRPSLSSRINVPVDVSSQKSSASLPPYTAIKDLRKVDVNILIGSREDAPREIDGNTVRS